MEFKIFKQISLIFLFLFSFFQIQAQSSKQKTDPQSIQIVRENLRQTYNHLLDAIEDVSLKLEKSLLEEQIPVNDPRFEYLNKLMVESQQIRQMIFTIQQEIIQNSGTEKDLINLKKPWAVYSYDHIMKEKYPLKESLNKYVDFLNTTYKRFLKNAVFKTIQPATAAKEYWDNDFKNAPVWLVLTTLDNIINDISIHQQQILNLLVMKFTIPVKDADVSHQHIYTVDIEDSIRVPQIKMTIKRDAAGGWNMHLKVDNFRFTPENANLLPIIGEGHAHLYLNGKKLARIYGEWYHIDWLPPGTNILKISLNANDHSMFTYKGKMIEKEVKVVVE